MFNCPICQKRAAIATSKQGIHCCEKCKHKRFVAKWCPVCKGPIDEKKTARGLYFVCFGGCGAFSPYKMMEFGCLNEEIEKV